MTLALAVDIGGTFTDAVLLSSGGETFVDKTLTTHDNLREGFFRAVDLVLGRADRKPTDVTDVVVHATTVVTNALIERKGPPVALILTKGFKDILSIRDEHRFDMYDPQIEYAAPLIGPERTFTITERTLADGTIAEPADPDELEGLAARCREEGIVSVAVCLLNAYADGRNEGLVREAFAKVAPDIFVSLSHEVAPQMREYRRASTVAINAYTEPITRPYLTALIDELGARGFRQKPLIMLSNGGVLSADRAARFPVRMIESGPAAGALVASHFSRILSLPDLISFDMGGTTAKACLINGHQPLVTDTFEVDRRYRFKPGSGMPITVPSIDMIEIGAGGGSIARVDALGLPKVGPDSAGSMPGPVAYGRGGTLPTVTDADVVLGIIDPDRFLGGDMRLDAGAARGAYAALGEALNLSPEGAAWGVFEVVCEQMAAATRAHATDRGVDYRGMPLLAFGGAGPVHACQVAELVEAGTVIYPPLASVLSAFGTLVSPAQIDLVQSLVAPLDALDWDAVAATLRAMQDDAMTALGDAGIPERDRSAAYSVDVRYLGQQSELRVSLKEDPTKTRDTEAIRDLFERQYEEQYGLKLAGAPVEVVAWRVTGRGGLPDRRTSAAPPRAAGKDASRTVYLHGKPHGVPVHQRAELSETTRIPGPVIVEERETTIFVLPGWTLRGDRTGSLIATRQEGSVG
ncbi:MAG: hydantoinase/oxoprolinase family protein [Pseudomonadota bacterium]